jgi:phosphoenolpyruvate carboxykinase (GTP)
VNYFLRDSRTGRWLNEKTDKKVWYKWIALRVHGEVAALQAPTGWIPRYDDLRGLFRDVLGKDYAHEDYVRQFSIPVPENLAKIDRIAQLYRTVVQDAPAILFSLFEEQRQRLVAAQKRHGDLISPDVLK